jgi:protein SCO1/2
MEADLNNWNFVTGEKEAIYKIANDYFVNVKEDDLAPGGFLHSEYFVLVDKEGRVRAREDDNGNNIGVYDGTSDYEVGLLIEDIKVLLAEYKLAIKNVK